MYISAVISEFNPFHYGHKFLINNIRKNGTTHIISVMSGNFVQRGEPAILSKWTRAEIALSCGVDLVIEIPAPWSVATAEKYAFAGVKIVNSLGCVNALYFGSECGDVGLLSKVSDILSEESTFDLIKAYLKQGITYARARESAVADCLGNNFKQLIRQPNNILGIEYIKALNKIKSQVSVHTIPRRGASHDSVSENDINNIVSASLIRNYIRNNKNIEEFVPHMCGSLIDRDIRLGKAPSDLLYTERAVLAKLRCMSVREAVKLPDVSEGIENRILNAVKESRTLEEVYFKAKTKRYTMSRIRRIILSAFLGISKDSAPENIPYIRVMGFNERGRQILKLIKHKAQLPLITGFAEVKKLDGECVKTFERECKISDLYSLMLPKISVCDTDKTSKIIVVK